MSKFLFLSICKLLGYLMAAIIISGFFGLFFLWVGITVSVTQTYLSISSTVRDFAMLGGGLGVVLSGVAIWIVEKGKRNG